MSEDVTPYGDPHRPPPWATKYLGYPAWTQDEFRHLLCGQSPHAEADMDAVDVQIIRSKAWNDEWIRQEAQRVEADRHIQDAILAGELDVLEPLDDQVLEKIRGHVTANEFEQLRRAVVHATSCEKAYRFAPAAAIRWAAAHRDLFPAFPFLDVGVSADIPDDIPEHRRLVRARAADPDQLQQRADWLQTTLDQRGVTLTSIEKHGGPDAKTLKKILKAQPVSEPSLRRLARALDVPRSAIP